MGYFHPWHILHDNCSRLIALTISTYFSNSLLRGSDSTRRPAKLNPWQGGPPASTCICPRRDARSEPCLSRMSSIPQACLSSHLGQANRSTGTSSRSIRFVDNVENAILSRSTAKTPLSPARESPRDSPPHPANRSANCRGWSKDGKGGNSRFASWAPAQMDLGMREGA